MNKRLCYIVVAGSLISLQGYAAKEKVIRFENRVRVGYDDNVNFNKNNEETSFISNVSQLTGKFVFSSRSELMLFWQPEFRYRFDVEPDFVSYQDLYGRLDHALSQRLFLTLSDRLRYQDKEAQSGAVSATDQNYLENDLKGALTFDLTNLSDIKLGAGYLSRVWDDDQYGKDLGNNFDRLSADANFIRQFFSEKTDAMVGLMYSDVAYEGSRGGYDSVVALLGLDQVFSSKTTAYGRLGVQSTTIENSAGGDSDSTTPYLNAGVDFKVSDRTSLNGVIGYSMYQSENTFYNAQERMNIALGGRRDITAKINLAATLSYTMSNYMADYVNDPNAPVIPDAMDQYISFALRGTYQINRNNFLELGYTYSYREVDAGTVGLSDYDRNRIDMGWKLRL